MDKKTFFCIPYQGIYSSLKTLQKGNVKLDLELICEEINDIDPCSFDYYKSVAEVIEEFLDKELETKKET